MIFGRRSASKSSIEVLVSFKERLPGFKKSRVFLEKISKKTVEVSDSGLLGKKESLFLVDSGVSCSLATEKAQKVDLHRVPFNKRANMTELRMFANICLSKD